MWNEKCHYAGCNLTHVQSDWDRISEDSENSKTSIPKERTLLAIFDKIWCCQPFWMATITKNHWNDCHASTSKNRDLQWKPNITNFRSIFNANISLTILDGSHYQKITKMVAMALPFRVNLQLEHIVDQLGWQPFSEITNMADLKWVKSELRRTPLHRLNLTLHGSNLIQWVTIY